jgi:hypothetical protein
MKQIEEDRARMGAMGLLNESNAAASVSPALLNRGTHVQESVSSALSEDSESDSDAGRPTVEQYLANPDMYLKPRPS